MPALILLTCPICKKMFNKNAAEVKRQLKKRSDADFYCSKECANIGTHKKQRNPIVKNTCPVCGMIFETKAGAKSKTFCSRSCASKGSVNEKRREAGRYASKLNFTLDTHSIYNIQKILKQREMWKYAEVKKLLDFINEPYEFEYVLDGKYIYDLVLFDRKIIIEFDGPDHIYLDESDKEKVAKINGFDLYRIKQGPNTVIAASDIYHLL